MASLYHPGLSEALERVRRMNDAELLRQIDSLYGRDSLPDDPTHEQLIDEASEQTRRDFRNPDAADLRHYIETMGKVIREHSRHS